MKIIALDIGGTAIKSAYAVNSHIQDFLEVPSNAKSGIDCLLKSIYKSIEHFGTADAIGISTTGQVDSENGIIVYANENAPGYRGTKLKDILTKRYNCPVFVENDVYAAAIGEYTFGAAVGQNNFLCLTYGTGIGGAIVIDGKVYKGSHSVGGGMMGHILIHPRGRLCSCGLRGCYEEYASTTALVRAAKKIYPECVNGRIIFEHFHNGDINIKKVVDKWIDEIIYGLISLIHIFNPSCVVLGGGVMKQDYVINQIRTRIKSRLIDNYAGIKIYPAHLGNNAGIYGMIAIAENSVYR